MPSVTLAFHDTHFSYDTGTRCGVSIYVKSKFYSMLKRKNASGSNTGRKAGWEGLGETVPGSHVAAS